MLLLSKQQANDNFNELKICKNQRENVAKGPKNILNKQKIRYFEIVTHKAQRKIWKKIIIYPTKRNSAFPIERIIYEQNRVIKKWFS